MFQLSRNISLTNTIFQAVFDPQTEAQNSAQLLELAVSWNCVDGAHDLFKQIQALNINSTDNTTKDVDRKYYPSLFEQALKENRPSFVDYFLRRYYNPLETTAFVKYKNSEGTSSNQASSNNFIDEEKMCVSCALYFIVEVLYKNAGEGPIVAAVALRSIPFINTNCFNQVLSRQWYGHLDGTSIETLWGTCKFAFHLASFGVFAPLFLNYRSIHECQEKSRQDYDTPNQVLDRGLDGIDDHSNEEVGYRHRWMQFHGSPAVMLLYICLLIAMFNFSINDVQAKNKYFWHYQRYQLTREYFEKPMFIYPPISLIIYVWLLIRLIIVRRTHFRVFKRLATPTWDTKWTDFENAATHKYARDLVEEKYRLHSKSNTTS
ncbi:unnamed protein product [Rotaria sordida]|uniref:Uncharacterized protein n=1 Tax=Rotaria sordida TaxID=392033 RepID=A0A815EL36_9BILA|nr:unnamed protein product [Rotaria sordida]